MDGLKKIDFKLEKNTDIKSDFSKPSSSATDGAANMRRKKIDFRKLLKSKRFRVGFVIVFVFLLFLVLGVYLPAVRAYKSAKVAYADAQAVSWAMKTQNVELASSQLAKTKTDLAQTQKDLNSMWYLRFIPIANFYYNDAYHLSAAGEHGLNAATILVDSVKPYADVLGLKGQGSFVGGTAQQRIETAVKTIGKITPKIDEISNELTIVRKEIDQVNPNHYPTFLVGNKIRDSLEKLKNITDQSVTIITSAKPLIKILPDILGEPNEKKISYSFSKR